MQPLLPKELPIFANAHILVVGDVMLDRYWFGETARISPEAPVPIVEINHRDDRPGGAANVALNLKALNVSTTLLGVTGNDEAAKSLSTLLSAAAINHHLYANPALATIIKLRIVSKHQQLLRADFESMLTALTLTPLLDTYTNSLAKAQVVILSDYKKGTLQDAQALIRLAKVAGAKVLVDPKETDYRLYANCDIITPNFKEFTAVVGHCANEQSIIDKGQALLKAHNIGALLITRGEYGMTLLHHNESFHYSADAREIVDVTGAGDTVISILAAALAAGLSIPQAAALANLGAGIAVTKLGAASVSPAELNAALSDKTRHFTGMLHEEQLVQAVEQARALGKRIVFTNGCFDILHAGHVACLQLAKSLGDYLIVAVNDDASIKKLKGESRPISRLEHRMSVLAGLAAVDWVVAFADNTPERLLRLLRPDVLVKGGEYQLNQVVGADIVQSYGGEVRIVGEKISSSSAIINKIAAWGKSEQEESLPESGVYSS